MSEEEFIQLLQENGFKVKSHSSNKTIKWDDEEFTIGNTKVTCVANLGDWIACLYKDNAINFWRYPLGIGRLANDNLDILCRRWEERHAKGLIANIESPSLIEDLKAILNRIYDK